MAKRIKQASSQEKLNRHLMGTRDFAPTYSGPSFAPTYRGGNAPQFADEDDQLTFLRTLLNPEQYPDPIPDSNQETVVTNIDSLNVAFSPTNDHRDYQIIQTPRALLYPVKVCIYDVGIGNDGTEEETYVNTGIFNTLVPVIACDFSRDYGSLYEGGRTASMVTKVEGGTVTAGTIALSGNYTAVASESIHNFSSFEPNKIVNLGITMKDQVTLKNLYTNPLVLVHGPEIVANIRPFPSDSTYEPGQLVDIRKVRNFSPVVSDLKYLNFFSISDGSLPDNLWRPALYHDIAFIGGNTAAPSAIITEPYLVISSKPLAERFKPKAAGTDPIKDKKYVVISTPQQKAYIPGGDELITHITDKTYPSLIGCTANLVDDKMTFNAAYLPMVITSETKLFDWKLISVGTFINGITGTPTISDIDYSLEIRRGYSADACRPCTVVSLNELSDTYIINLTSTRLTECIPGGEIAPDVKARTYSKGIRSNSELTQARKVFSDLKDPIARIMSLTSYNEILGKMGNVVSDSLFAKPEFGPVGTAVGGALGGILGNIIPFSDPAKKYFSTVRRFTSGDERDSTDAKPNPSKAKANLGAIRKLVFDKKQNESADNISISSEGESSEEEENPELYHVKASYVSGNIILSTNRKADPLEELLCEGLANDMDDTSNIHNVGNWQGSSVIVSATKAHPERHTLVKKIPIPEPVNIDSFHAAMVALDSEPWNNTMLSERAPERKKRSNPSVLPKVKAKNKRYFSTGNAGVGVVSGYSFQGAGTVRPKATMNTREAFKRCSKHSQQRISELISARKGKNAVNGDFGFCHAPAAYLEGETATGEIYTIFCTPEPLLKTKVSEDVEDQDVITTYGDIDVAFADATGKEAHGKIRVDQTMMNDPEAVHACVCASAICGSFNQYFTITLDNELEAGGGSMGLACLLASMSINHPKLVATGRLDWKGDDSMVSIKPVGDVLTKVKAAIEDEKYIIVPRGNFTDEILKNNDASDTVVTVQQMYADISDDSASVLRVENLADVLLMCERLTSVGSKHARPTGMPDTVTPAEKEASTKRNKETVAARQEILTALSEPGAVEKEFPITIGKDQLSAQLFNIEWWKRYKTYLKDINVTLDTVNAKIHLGAIKKLRGLAIQVLSRARKDSMPIRRKTKSTGKSRGQMYREMATKRLARAVGQTASDLEASEEEMDNDSGEEVEPEPGESSQRGKRPVPKPRMQNAYNGKFGTINRDTPMELGLAMIKAAVNAEDNRDAHLIGKALKNIGTPAPNNSLWRSTVKALISKKETANGKQRANQYKQIGSNRRGKQPEKGAKRRRRASVSSAASGESL